jgi:glycosyltransferase involved in cell wall biosynthesis
MSRSSHPDLTPVVQPLVSIVMPCFNAEPWIGAALESVLSQTWRRWEAIVVDDGSKDESLAIARRFESSQVRVLQHDNAGAAATRNRAYDVCQGDFIQYLDADDILAPDKIALQIQRLTCSDGDGCVSSGTWRRFQTDIAQASTPAPKEMHDMEPVEWLIWSWSTGTMMHPAAWLVPRAIADAAGRWDESLSLNDDGEYFGRVVLSSRRILHCEAATTYYRSGMTSSLSAMRCENAWLSAMRSFDLCTQHLLAYENSPRSRLACANLYQRFVFDVFPHAPVIISNAEKRIRDLGGSDRMIAGGSMLRVLAKLIGWKRAKKLKLLVQRIIAKQSSTSIVA